MVNGWYVLFINVSVVLYVLFGSEINIIIIIIIINILTQLT